MSVWDTVTETKDLDERQKAGEVPFIGQQHIKDQIEPFLGEDKMPHILLTGDPGMGKTQFARWVAWRRQKPFFERMTPLKATHLPPYGILLADEVHRQNHPEQLFPIMDRGLLTFVAATTKPEKLDSAFRSRFLFTIRLKRYSLDEMMQVVSSMAAGSEWEVPEEQCRVLASAANGHPRTAEKIVKTAVALGTFDPGKVLRAVRITADGLGDDHFDYLAALDVASKPMGLNQLSMASWLTEDELLRIERTLIEKGFAELTPSGRTLTLRGKQYVDKLKEDGIWDE